MNVRDEQFMSSNKVKMGIPITTILRYPPKQVHLAF